jgi:hypothetical protein
MIAALSRMRASPPDLTIHLIVMIRVGERDRLTTPSPFPFLKNYIPKIFTQTRIENS